MVAASGTPAWASGGVPDAAPTAKTRIGANECWTGPLMPGQQPPMMIAQSNRYAPMTSAAISSRPS
jgi:histidinol-phosphate aminotransferase